MLSIAGPEVSIQANYIPFLTSDRSTCTSFSTSQSNKGKFTQLGTPVTDSSLEVMVCPFCGFHDPVLYKIQFHIESFHTPDSPFIIEEEKAQIMELIEDEDSYARRKHAENHGGSKALVHLKNPRSRSERSPAPTSSSPSSSHQKKHSRTGEEQSRKKSKLRKLGTTQLGPTEMPPIKKHMKFAPNGTLVEVYTVVNETTGLIPVIAKLCEKDDCVTHAWLCDGAVRHVGKQMHKEGGFCSYRNIQMMISYIQGAYVEGGTWGLIRMGGSKRGYQGYTKYIGTSEVETLFASTGLPCGVKHLSRYDEQPAHEVLYDFVQRHFEEGRSRGNSDRILQTCRPPIYFQHAGMHSMTIPTCFDPSYSPCPGIRDLVGVSKIGSKANVHALLRLHRRGDNYLYKYREFELLTMLPDNKYTGIIEGFHMHEFLKSRYS
ncbi:hypothetical protein BGX38DRAFT_1154818 [Terfezia claveryi]|nr:hypothetical protein BGX38DRAFT_1154818 [Terfezia claveryi]